MVAELGEVRAQAELVADQEALAAQPEQVRERDACARRAPPASRPARARLGLGLGRCVARAARRGRCAKRGRAARFGQVPHARHDSL